MMAFLPPISQTTRFSSRWPGSVLPARFPNSQADFARAGERDHLDFGMIDQMLADDGAVAREEIEHARRHTCFLEHLHQHGTGDGRWLGRLHDDCVAGHNRGRDHAGENRDREIPGRDDERDAARPVMLIAFFAEHVLGESRTAHEAHLLGVEKAEIHRLANVAIRFRPGFADFVNFHGGKFETAPLHDGRDAFE